MSDPASTAAVASVVGRDSAWDSGPVGLGGSGDWCTGVCGLPVWLCSVLRRRRRPRRTKPPSTPPRRAAQGARQGAAQPQATAGSAAGVATCQNYLASPTLSARAGLQLLRATVIRCRLSPLSPPKSYGASDSCSPAAPSLSAQSSCSASISASPASSGSSPRSSSSSTAPSTAACISARLIP